jgi:RNA recognition motif-containing protein
MKKHRSRFSNKTLRMRGRGKDDSERVVFVGNVNFDATEEQLMAVFSQVGPVANIRLKYDREVSSARCDECVRH